MGLVEVAFLHKATTRTYTVLLGYSAAGMKLMVWGVVVGAGSIFFACAGGQDLSDCKQTGVSLCLQHGCTCDMSLSC